MKNTVLSILNVDNDSDDALWLSDIIREIVPDYTCYFEKDGVAALRFIKNNPPPDFVFLDLNMPFKKRFGMFKRHL